MRPLLIVFLGFLGLTVAGCESSGAADRQEAKDSRAQSRYQVIEVDECIEASSFGARDARISDRQYAKPSISAATVLGVSKSGDCIVMSRINRAEDQGCFIDVQLRLEESKDKVVVSRVTRRRLIPVEKGACSLDMVSDSIAIQLSEPLGDRQIVDAVVQ